MALLCHPGIHHAPLGFALNGDGSLFAPPLALRQSIRWLVLHDWIGHNGQNRSGAGSTSWKRRLFYPIRASILRLFRQSLPAPRSDATGTERPG